MTKKITTIIYDFDGVLTDNRVWVTQDGQESVACNRSDGWWMKELKAQNIEQMILSTEQNPVVSARGKKLEIPVQQGESNKLKFLESLVQSKGLHWESIAYVGNDMNDYPCMKQVGYALAPQDSHPKILEIAHWVIPVNGGMGVVRHIYDWLNA